MSSFLYWNICIDWRKCGNGVIGIGYIMLQIDCSIIRSHLNHNLTAIVAHIMSLLEGSHQTSTKPTTWWVSRFKSGGWFSRQKNALKPTIKPESSSGTVACHSLSGANIVREHVMRRILNPIMGMFTATRGWLRSIYVCLHPMEWMAAHRSYALSCSMWQHFRVHLVTEKIHCWWLCVRLFLRLWWHGMFIILHRIVCVIAMLLPYGKGRCLYHVIIIMNYCTLGLFVDWIRSMGIVETKCRRKLPGETTARIWIQLLPTHTTRICLLYLHDSTIWIWWTCCALNGDMLLFHLMIQVFWLVSPSLYLRCFVTSADFQRFLHLHQDFRGDPTVGWQLWTWVRFTNI